MLKQELQQRQTHNQALTQKHIQSLERTWDMRNSDLFAYVPHEKRGTTSIEKARMENEGIGAFASNYMKTRLAKATFNQKLEHRAKRQSLLFVGFGRGYDAHFLPEAYQAGLNVVCLDVSSVACQKAQKNMEEQWRHVPPSGIARTKPRVIQGEIKSVLANPAMVDLDMSSIKVFYFCRTLTCLSVRSAKAVLENIGELFSAEQDPDKEKWLVIVAALKEDNPNRVGKTSKIYTLSEILAPIRKGAQRAVEAVYKATYVYFGDQVYTAVTIRCV